MCELRTILALGLFAATALGQETNSYLLPPGELVRHAIHNEIKATNEDNQHFFFRSTKTTPKGSVTKIYVETKQATAGLVVAMDGKPLTPEQREAEETRVRRFLNDPEELRKKRNQEHEDTVRTMKIVRAIPDAFIFKYAGEEASSSGMGQQGHKLVKLTFHPNPDYDPPSRVEQVLTGMEGFVLIDPESSRLASIDGTLFREVSFGWGILGHLDRGGHFLVHQEQVSGDIWQISRMDLKFTGKIMMFKKFAIESLEVFSDFKRVAPNLTFAQALDLLHREELASANPAESRLAQ